MAKPENQPARRPRAIKHTIVVNGEALQVTAEERLQWVVCAGALTGDLSQMRIYFGMRESDQLRHELKTPTTPLTIVLCATPARRTVGDALNLLRCGSWEHQYDDHYVIKLSAKGLDVALRSPELEQQIDEEKLSGSLGDAADLQHFLEKRSQEILARRTKEDNTRQS